MDTGASRRAVALALLALLAAIPFARRALGHAGGAACAAATPAIVSPGAGG